MNREDVIRDSPLGSARRVAGQGGGLVRQRDPIAAPGAAVPVEHIDPPLAGRYVLLVAGCSGEADGPGVNALAVHFERAAGRVSILPSASMIADLLGRRVVGHPDLIITILPGRGASMAAVRVAERLGAPLLAVLNSDWPPSWGEVSTLRRATRVAVTRERLRDRVTEVGVAREKVELWRALLPTALSAFDQIVGRTLRTAMPASALEAG
jgi:hypothetical protein